MQRKIIAIIAIVFSWAAVQASSSELDYCSICSDHTMCRFGEDATGSACGRKTEGGVSRTEIEEILRIHNDFRSGVAQGKEPRGSPGPQPPAADMYALVWDDKLAEVAQRWADQCTFKHDKCRDDPRFPVGQNIYWSSSSKPVSWSRAVQTWYDEVSQLSPRNVSSYGLDFNTGHYAQLTWAKTRHVGCARRSYGGSYRPRASRPIEYVLSEVRVAADAAAKNVTEEDSAAPRRVARQEPGYFGGASLDPAGTQGALTQKPASGQHRPSVSARPLPVGSAGQTPSRPPAMNFYRPTYHYPTNAYPTGFVPYYPYGRYASFKPDDELHQRVLEDSPESLENSSEDIDDERAGAAVNGEDPKSLRLNSWTSQGWMTRNYDMARDQIFICNYGPSGNFLGEPIYQSGEPCSKCPEDTTCRDGLCV